MPHEVFTDDWSRACRARLNSREGYRRVAATWRNPVILLMRADPALGLAEHRAVYLDLADGECRDARVATAADFDAATYVLAADAAQWRRILDGQLDPITAIMFGKLRLEKGALASLVPYSAAAREMVAAVAEVESHFPVLLD